MGLIPYPPRIWSRIESGNLKGYSTPSFGPGADVLLRRDAFRLLAACFGPAVVFLRRGPFSFTGCIHCLHCVVLSIGTPLLNTFGCLTFSQTERRHPYQPQY